MTIDPNVPSIEQLSQYDGLLPPWLARNRSVTQIEPICRHCGNEVQVFGDHAPECKWNQPEQIESIYGYMCEPDIIACVDAEDDPHFPMFVTIALFENDVDLEHDTPDVPDQFGRIHNILDWMPPRQEGLIKARSYYGQQIRHQHFIKPEVDADSLYFRIQFAKMYGAYNPEKFHLVSVDDYGFDHHISMFNGLPISNYMYCCQAWHKIIGWTTIMNPDINVILPVCGFCNSHFSDYIAEVHRNEVAKK